MIKLSRINGENFVLNCNLIETIETTPDTVITLTSGKKIIVKESTDNIIEKIIQYRKKTLSPRTK